MKNYWFIIVSFLSVFTVSAQQVSGVILNEFSEPLQGANIMLLPEDQSKKVQFTASKANGSFSFEVSTGIFTIKVNFLGYKAYEEKLNLENQSLPLKIQLQPKEDQLDEVLIDYKYQPIKAKLDTIVVDVQAFSNGKERKLKELLNKVPGLEVDRNGIIKLNGKTVQYFLVENKVFFGGGSKLGVENIPADAVKQIELLDNFTEVEFLKDVLNTDELALNVTLKEDKKNLFFGDLEVGLGNKKFRDLHAALFYYSPQKTFNFIGDHNTYGKAALSEDDIFRFLGNKSKFTLNTNNLNSTNASLFSMGKENREVVETQSEIAALNYTKDYEKTDFNTYLIFNQNEARARKENRINYLQNNTSESRNSLIQNRSLSGLASFQLNYKRNKNSRMRLQTDANFSVSDNSYFLESFSTDSQNQINQKTETDFFDVNALFEYHRSFSKNTKSTLVFSSNINQRDPISLYESAEPILPNQIALIQDDQYFIEQIQQINNQEHQIRFRLYQILSNNLHVNFDVGNVLQYSNFISNETQLLSNGSQNSFENQGFGNDLNYTLNNAYVGAEFSFKIGKLINKPALNLHYYYFNKAQQGENRTHNQLLFEPKWDAQLNITKSEKISFNYTWNNQFPRPELVASQLKLQQFNLVFRGNELLQQERFHNFRLHYTNFNSPNNFSYFGSLYLNRKTKVIREQVVLEGINQFLTPELRDTPENYYGGSFSISKKIQFIEPFVRPSFSVSDYSQLVNNEDVASKRQTQNLEAGFYIRGKKLPYIKFSYQKSYQQFSGITDADFETDEIKVNLDYVFLNNWNLTSDFTYFKNQQIQGFTEEFNFLDFSLSYQKENSPWLFSVLVNNAIDVKNINRNQFSDFTTNQATSFVLPRMFLAKIAYKF